MTMPMKLAQPNIKLVQASFPFGSNKAEVELEANRTLPTGIEFFDNSTKTAIEQSSQTSSTSAIGPTGPENSVSMQIEISSCSGSGSSSNSHSGNFFYCKD
jgi:hypothetical protein